jgi:hypothetical protein
MRDDVHGPGSPTGGHHANGSSSPTPPFTRRLPDDDIQAPIDLVAVQADDELVNALGARPAGPPVAVPPEQSGPDGTDGAAGAVGGPSLGGGHAGGRGADDRLVAMLAAWRAEIDAEPIPELIDLDAAVAAVTAGIAEQATTTRRRRAGRLRHLAPLVAAAAIILATVTGVGLGSQNAMPGDTLWPIQKVVNPDRAESVKAKVKVESRLETVRAALKQGDTATAAKELEAIRTEIPAVRGQEGQPQLVQEQAFLAAKLVDTPAGQPADLSTPPKSDPAARPTGALPPPPPPPADSSATEPSPSQSAAVPKPVEPDVRKSVPDRSSAAVAPEPPVRTEPVPPAPERPAPDVTKPPEAPPPASQPDPTSPGKSEGKPDPTGDPGPVDPPPASGTDPSPGGDDTGGSGSAGGGGDGTSSDTTTAAGAVGADVATTATDTTT